jgi:hypothetical protein
LKRMLERCVLAVEVSEDRLHTLVAAAGEYERMVLVELAAYLDGTAGVVDAVQELRVNRRVDAVAIDPHSHAANLIRMLTEAGIRVTELSSRDVAAAHGQFLDELAAGRLRHVGDPRLDAAVRHATQRPLGGGDTWLRRGVPVDVSPLTAATLAHWVAQERQRKPKIS